ncbi:M48 family metallopeptidase [Legionella geestiana]|nr:SprT family zinc-dependent metalloprotease [Legionella geestiana]
MYLRVCPSTGQLRISAPRSVSAETIRAFIQTRISWIQQQQSRIQTLKPSHPYTYTDGERHYIFGKPCVLRLVEATNSPELYQTDAELILQVPADVDVEYRKNVFRAGLAGLLQKVLAPSVAQWAKTMGVSVSRCNIRLMRSRWGSCSPHSRSIRINLELVKKPPECIEYVVVHELAHLLEPSHNWRFKAIMNEFLPDWRARRMLLKHSPG